MKKKEIRVISKVEQSIPITLQVQGLEGNDTVPKFVFLKDKEYTAKIYANDELVAIGEDGIEYRIGGDGDGRAFWRSYEFSQKFEIVDPFITCIETDVYEPVPDKPGLIRWVRQRTVDEVYKDTVRFLKEQGLYDELDYFSQGGLTADKNRDFPKWNWVACYAVKGASEGYYIHLDVITADTGILVPLFTGKTFGGMDFALKVSNALTKVFWDEF